MSCTVAISNSPAFSPATSRIPVTNSLLCRSASFSSSSSSSSSPSRKSSKTLTRFPSFTTSSSLSPSSQLRSLRIQAPISLIECCSSSPCRKSSEKLTLTRFPSFTSSSIQAPVSLIECSTSSSPSRKSSEKLTLTRFPSFTSSSQLGSLRIQAPISLTRNGNSNECSTSTAISASSTVLKRKRPARLDIPVVLTNFGNFTASPSAAADFVEVEGDEYSVCCKRGRRGAMEDCYSAFVNLQGDSKQGIFGVFDGHGGDKAAEFAAEHLNKNIMDELSRRDEEDVVEAVKNGYLMTDSEFLSEEYRGGSCCLTALIRKGNLVVSNAGDCRAVVSRGGIAEALTSDHKPSRKDEKDRIETLGGYVDCSNGVWRIQGSLAVSRGIGDRYLKQWVIAEPETTVLELNPELEFLILASDGLWDKVSNQEVVDAARPFCTDISKPQPLLASKKLVDLAISRGSVDDISVMIIQLQQFC